MIGPEFESVQSWIIKYLSELIISIQLVIPNPSILRFSIIYGAPSVPEPEHHGWLTAQVQFCAPTPVAVPLIKIGSILVEPEQSLFSIILSVHSDSKMHHPLSFSVFSETLLRLLCCKYIRMWCQSQSLFILMTPSPLYPPAEGGRVVRYI